MSNKPTIKDVPARVFFNSQGEAVAVAWESSFGNWQVRSIHEAPQHTQLRTFEEVALLIEQVLGSTEL